MTAETNMQRDVHGIRIECIQGDITRQADIGIIVNAANRQLRGGGGVDGAINRAAGPKLVEASRVLGPVEAGDAVITPAFDLPNDYVVHCVGPIYSQSQPVAEQLARCYRMALALAAEADAESIAFPAISCGVYGYPLQAAAEIAVGAVVESADQYTQITLVRFVLFSGDALDSFSVALESAAVL